MKEASAGWVELSDDEIKGLISTKCHALMVHVGNAYVKREDIIADLGRIQELAMAMSQKEAANG